MSPPSFRPDSWVSSPVVRSVGAKSVASKPFKDHVRENVNPVNRDRFSQFIRSREILLKQLFLETGGKAGIRGGNVLFVVYAETQVVKITRAQASPIIHH